MAARLFVWDQAIGLVPDAPDFFYQLERLIMAESADPPTVIIQEFVAKLTQRYPDLTDTPDGQAIDPVNDTIWSMGPLLACAHGGAIDLAMVWAGYGAGGDFVLQTASGLGLSVFDE